MRKTDAVHADAVRCTTPVVAKKVVGGEETDAVAPNCESAASSWDTTVSCVPPGESWVTMVDPPRREKRPRKSSARKALRRQPSESSDGNQSSDSQMPAHRSSSETAPLDNDDLELPPAYSLLPTGVPMLSVGPMQSAADDVHSLMAPDQFAEMAISNRTAENSFEEDGECTEDPVNHSKRKVRHNQTERRRVDRMNQLFKKLYMVVEDTAPPSSDGTGSSKSQEGERLGVCGADGKPINPNKWSKADVLEGALNVILDLRKQLVEERLARSLGVPVQSAAEGSAQLALEGNHAVGDVDVLTDDDMHVAMV